MSIFRRVTPSRGGCELTTAASLMRLSSTITRLSCLDLRPAPIQPSCACLCRNCQLLGCAKRPARPCPPRPLCYALPASRPGRYTARANMDRPTTTNASSTHSLSFPSTRRCVCSSCTPQHDTSQHWRSRHRKPARPLGTPQPESASRFATHGVQGVTCRASRLELAWASGFGSDRRWHATG